MTTSREKILLVIDVQGCFFFGDYILPDKESLLANVVSVVDKARAANPPIKVIWVRHQEAGGEMIPNTPLWEIMKPLSPLPTESIVEKKFPNSFKETTLTSLLPKDPNTFELILVGLQSDMCINFTSRGAVEHYGKDVKVSVVSGAHATYASEDGSKSAKEVACGVEEGLKEVGVKIIAMDSLPF